MVQGEQKQGHDHSGESDRIDDLEKPRLCFTICRNHFVVEESFQEVANQKMKLTLFLRIHHRHVSLHFERQHGKFRRQRTMRSRAKHLRTLMASTNSRATDLVSSCWTSCAKTLSRLASSISPVSSEGLASARIFPLRDDDNPAANLLHYFENMRDVENGLPCRGSSSNRSLNRREERTSSPESGSSKMSSLGSCMSAAAISTRCFIPLEYIEIGECRHDSRPSSCSSRWALIWICRSRSPRSLPTNCRYSRPER